MITETDLDNPNLAELFEDGLTWAEWWAEFDANACCPDKHTAARRLCGCGGSAAFYYPEASRLLTGEPA
ncbi:hypothetical protein SEA_SERENDIPITOUS_97 [Mycobacterium phage Serendipitous]|uniref:Uncharacterized protein n=1 Tax=Mycobacterium phage Serendipitous TaxID=2301619 RepID=A0A385UGJ2_9CAUD|nr:hypothetical protein I5G64_gp97 [Mycobacterium phage Serendipitous]AYB70638.1 hypothetical protein SEA_SERENDIPITOUS_97 [Mycobacterium phage Serendipitous]